jgi:basic amino acid/polyamine antiporter, APA family
MKLGKQIGLAGVFSIATGAMISSGIFILPGLAFAKAGSAAFISYFVAGIMALLGIFSTIELSTAMPKAGGDYYYINRSFGPLIGTISGLLGWLALVLKSSFAIFGISEVLFIFFNIPLQISSASLCLIFLCVSLAGAKQAVIFQVVLVTGLLGLLAAFVVVGLPNIDSSQFTSLSDTPVNNIVIASGFIFISFGGLLKVASISEEVRNPKRNIPLGMITSVIVVTLLYTLVVVVLVGTLEPDVLSGSLTPVADSARILLGAPGYLAITIAALLAFVTTANAGLMSASRYPIALARDSLIPSSLAFVSKKKKTPVLALVLTALLIYLSQLLPLEALVKAASTVILTSYVLTNFAVIIMRESKLSNYRPSFRAPFYPWLQIVCVVLFSFFIIDIGAEAVEISLAFVFACVLLYLFYGRRKNNSIYALLHLLKRITDKRLTGDLLENELRDILISRDEIEQDSFDELVKNAVIVDIDGPLDFQRLLFSVAKDIARISGMDEKTVIQLNMERQTESNTAVSNFLAIPHIVINEGARSFAYIVRCNEGVNFTADEPRVHAIFFFGGTKQTRTLHLKTIAALSTTVSQPDFQEKWLNCRNPVEIRNLMMLAKRKRFF